MSEARAGSHARRLALGLLRVLREIGVAGERPATRAGAVESRRALKELGTTFIKLGQLLSSRPDLLPDVYIDELAKLVDTVPPVPFEALQAVIDGDIGLDAFIDRSGAAGDRIGCADPRCAAAERS